MIACSYIASHCCVKNALGFFLAFLLLLLPFVALAHPLSQAPKQVRPLVSAPSLPAPRPKSVSQLKVGDVIRARNHATGKVEWKQVIHASKRTVPSMLSVQLADTKTDRPSETLVCPLDEMVRLTDGSAISARHLAIGNSIVTRAGPICKVNAMFLLRKPGGFVLCDVRIGSLSAANAKLLAISQKRQRQNNASFANYKVPVPRMAYATPNSSGGGTPNPFLFQGQQFDPASNTYYLRARYYAPSDGRFLSPDPFDGRDSDPISLHRYLYASNNPVNRIDPGGREDLASLSIGEAQSATLDAIDTGAIQGGKAFAKDAIGEAIDAESPQAIAERGAAESAEEVSADLSDIVDIGNEGESAAEEQIPGFVKNTKHIEDFTGKRAYRIPDQLDRVNKIIGEVKNVKRLDFRSQIKNDLKFAEKYGYTFRLYVRPGIQLAPKIKEAIDDGRIVLQYLNLP